MEDARKSKTQLIAELDTLRRRVETLERERAHWEETRTSEPAPPLAHLPETAFAGLLELMRTLVTTRKVEVFLDKAVHTAVDSVPAADSGSIQLLEPGGDILRTVAGTGMGKAKRGTTRFQPGVGVAGYALQAGKVINVPDVLDDARFVPGVMPLRFRALMVAPLVVEGRAPGTLSLSSARVNAFAPEDEAVIEVIANAVAFALENTRLVASLCASEDALRRSEAQYRTLFEAIPDTVFIVDQETGQFLDINSAGCQIYGYERDEFLRLNAMAISAEPERTEEVLRLGELYVPLRYHKRKDGTVFPVEISMSLVVLDGRPLVVGTSRDITERIRAEEALRQLNTELEARVVERTAELARERERLGIILESMGEGVIHTDAEGIIQYVNQPVTTLTGYSAEALIGQPWSILYVSLLDSDAQAKIGKAVLSGQTWRGESRLRRKDGTTFDAGLSVSQSTLPLGEGWFIAVVRDISQEKALQAQKDRFIAHASHELRTPLSNIIARLYLIRRQADRTDAHLAVIETAARRMRELVEDLLDLSRFERGVIPIRRTTTELRFLIDEVVMAQQPHATFKRITFTSAVPDDPVRILADPNRIIQVITNLVDNAINYTPEGGKVNVSLDMDSDGYAVVRVRDSGPGMPREILPRLFEPFFRASEGAVRGSGLGLTISREIVAAHGGDIWVESAEGVGSVFTVRLPLLDTQGTAQTESASSTAR